eukprot:TRINITY_DN1088_c0_g2_i1.p1 TRINITY_DN1088_c0_g2~~TRINITY_DN1088_c0_g2_i1.p1  ORF type:complete len:162 (+),score=11.05 TRINITY_DN1088_c0_g2_i1:55-540(+)
MYGSVRGRAWRADVVVVLVVCTLSRPAHAQGSAQGWAGATGAASADMVGAAAYISTVTAALNDCAGKADGATCTLTFTMTRRDKSGESSSVACSGDLPISRGTNFTCTESSGLEVASLEWWTWLAWVGKVLVCGGLMVFAMTRDTPDVVRDAEPVHQQCVV